MRLLLDTHIFLWCLSDDRQLSKKARSMMQSATEVYVSSASIWEASIKMKIGKLNADLDSLVVNIIKSGFLELPIGAAHAAYTYHLPDIHKDPFDRMLIAQSTLEPLRLITADKILKDYSDLVELV